MPKGKNMIRFVRRADVAPPGAAPGANLDTSKPISITWDDLEAAISGVPSNASSSSAANVDMYLDEDAEKSEIPTFTAEQVALHNKRDDLWIIVNGLVYDVTTYLPVHQGGDALLKWAGKEATAAVY